MMAKNSDTKHSLENFFRLPDFSTSDIGGFVSDFPKKVCGSIEALLFEAQLHLKQWNQNKSHSTKVELLSWGKNMSSTAGLSLEEQMYPWKENPSWVDSSPQIKVTVPEGSLCNLNLEVNVGLPPEAVFNIVTDPDNKRVFKNIKEVVSRKVIIDEGSRQVVEVEQAAIWKFFWWSGTISVHVLVDQNKDDYTMKFKQIKSGFMEKFEGCWKMEPIYVDEELCHPLIPTSVTDYVSCTKGRGRIGSRLSLQQLIQPSIVPPAPISWYLRGITTKTTEMLIHDLLAETSRIREESSSTTSHLPEEKSGAFLVDDVCNIKERWDLRRKNARRFRRRCRIEKELARMEIEQIPPHSDQAG